MAFFLYLSFCLAKIFICLPAFVFMASLVASHISAVVQLASFLKLVKNIFNIKAKYKNQNLIS